MGLLADFISHIFFYNIPQSSFISILPPAKLAAIQKIDHCTFSIYTMKSIKIDKTALLSLLILMLLGLSTLSHAQQFQWGHSIDVGDWAQARAVTTDTAGFIYLGIDLTEPADLDPGPGTFTLTPTISDTVAEVIAKYDSNGQFVWAVKIDGKVKIAAMDIDPAGNLCAAGIFEGTVDFDPGMGQSIYTAQGYQDIFTLKLSPAGNLIWAITQPGNYFSNIHGLKTDTLGNIITVGTFSDSLDADPGPGILLFETSGNFHNSFVSKLTPNGTLDWAISFEGTSGNEALSLELDDQGFLYVPGKFSGTCDFDPGVGTNSITSTANHDAYLAKLGPQGNLVGLSIFQGAGSGSLYDVALNSMGELYVSGLVFAGNLDMNPGSGVNTLTLQNYTASFLVKLTPSMAFDWAIPFNTPDGRFNIYDIEITQSDNLICLGTIRDSMDVDPGPGIHTLVATGNTDPVLLKLAPNGNFLWAGQIPGSYIQEVHDMHLDNDSSLFLSGYYRFDVDLDPTAGSQQHTASGWSESFLVKMKITPETNLIQGLAYFDQNQNCQRDLGERILTGLHTQLMPNNWFTTTQADGLYSFRPDTGTWTVSMAPPAPTWSVNCPATGIHTAPLPNANDSLLGLDFALTGPDCPYMAVNMAGNRYRAGRQSTIVLNWCNLGAGVADSAYIELTNMNPLLSIDSASLNWRLPQTGNTYIFDLDSVGILECGNITLHTKLDSFTTIGSAICLEAHIYPDSFCFPPNPAWDKSHVEINVACSALEDSAHFTISNVSTHDMTGIGGLVVLQDDVLIMQDSVVLTAGQDTVVSFKADGSTWAMKVQQTAFHPGLSYPTAFIEGCGTDSAGGFSTQFVAQYPMDDLDHFQDIYCGEVIGSWDPNDKIGYPVGFYANHEIETNRPIDYVVNFQNTGNDTAFKVVIRDTLDPLTMDIRTLRHGASSHPYSFRLYGQGIAEWTFSPIQLPDSNVNLLGSQGFVSFTLNQMPNNPVGTRIENSADIYFDFNLPVLTNTAWHTVGGTFIEFIDIDLIQDSLSGIPETQKTRILLYPNPFTEYFTLEAEHTPYQKMELTLLDPTGKTVKSAQVHNTNQIQVFREGLARGLYLYQLKGDGDLISTGKLILR